MRQRTGTCLAVCTPSTCRITAVTPLTRIRDPLPHFGHLFPGKARSCCPADAKIETAIRSTSASVRRPATSAEMIARDTLAWSCMAGIRVLMNKQRTSIAGTHSGRQRIVTALMMVKLDMILTLAGAVVMSMM